MGRALRRADGEANAVELRGREIPSPGRVRFGVRFWVRSAVRFGVRNGFVLGSKGAPVSLIPKRANCPIVFPSLPSLKAKNGKKSREGERKAAQSCPSAAAGEEGSEGNEVAA